MTSRLRRKPPTTAWSTPSKKTSTAWCVRGDAAGWLAGPAFGRLHCGRRCSPWLARLAAGRDGRAGRSGVVWPPTTRTGPADQSYVRTVAYSSGRATAEAELAPRAADQGPGRGSPGAPWSQRQPARPAAEPIPDRRGGRSRSTIPFGDPPASRSGRAGHAAGRPDAERRPSAAAPGALSESAQIPTRPKSRSRSRCPRWKKPWPPARASTPASAPRPRASSGSTRSPTTSRAKKGRFPRECGIETASLPAAMLGADHVQLEGVGPLPQAALLRGGTPGAIRPHLGTVPPAAGLRGPLLPHRADPALRDGALSARRVHLQPRLLPARQLCSLHARSAADQRSRRPGRGRRLGRPGCRHPSR